MTGKKRILTVSHGITSVTGFANQHYLLDRALMEAGWEVFSCHRDYRGEPITFAPGTKTEGGRDLSNLTMLPWGMQLWLEDRLEMYIEKYQPDYVFTLGDIWCYQYIREFHRNHNWRWIAHYVFDTENMVSIWNKSLQSADWCVVPAKFADELVRVNRHQNVSYIPHGIDTNTYAPCTPEEKKEFRKKLDVPQDAFIISCVAHNQQRKMMSRLLQAFTLFSRKNPDAYLFLHMSPIDQNGWNLPVLIKDFGIAERVLFTNKGAKQVGDLFTPERELREFYCASDVHALSTGGEGFGVPLVEAMACGIPNVTTHYTTAEEFLCDVSTDAKGKKLITQSRGVCIPYTDIEFHHTGGIWALIDVVKMAEAFQMLKDNPTTRYEMGIKAREFAVEHYDSELIKNYWREFFANIDGKIAELEAKNDASQLRSVRVFG